MKKQLFLSLFILLFLQIATFFLFSENALPKLGLRFTPDKTHFKSGNFEWVLLQNDGEFPISENAFNKMKEIFKENYKTIYLKESEIPESFLQKDIKGASYKDGFSYKIERKYWGLFFVTVRFQDYEGSRASAMNQISYVWLLGFWIKIMAHFMAVS
ncbi:MAG: hypothetical protein HQM08_29940 [Candidatus Riflebacteria bacterium]|nr:hypothetical protein [Candidatus Riflebacteria bacterium]